MALQRMEAALARLEAAISYSQTNTGDTETAQALAALEARHHRLREAVRRGLGQLDGLLGDLAADPASGHTP